MGKVLNISCASEPFRCASPRLRQRQRLLGLALQGQTCVTQQGESERHTSATLAWIPVKGDCNYTAITGLLIKQRDQANSAQNALPAHISNHALLIVDAARSTAQCHRSTLACDLNHFLHLPVALRSFPPSVANPKR